MANVEIGSETSLSMQEMKEELERIRKRDKELGFRASRTEEYLQNFVESKKAADIKKKLVELGIPRLREQHICKIVDIMPASQNDLKAVLQGYNLSLSSESMKKILDTVNEG